MGVSVCVDVYITYVMGTNLFTQSHCGGQWKVGTKHKSPYHTLLKFRVKTWLKFRVRLGLG